MFYLRSKLKMDEIYIFILNKIRVFLIFICFRVIAVNGEECVYLTNTGKYDYRFCKDDCCGTIYDRYCCDLDDDDERYEQKNNMGLSIGIISGTIVGFILLLGVVLVCVRLYWFKKRPPANTNHQTNTDPPRYLDIAGPNGLESTSTQRHEVCTISGNHMLKPPPYTPMEPSAPPSYDEIMELERMEGTK